MLDPEVIWRVTTAKLYVYDTDINRSHWNCPAGMTILFLELVFLSMKHKSDIWPCVIIIGVVSRHIRKAQHQVWCIVQINATIWIIFKKKHNFK